jgi:predicted transcriptional regulator
MNAKISDLMTTPVMTTTPHQTFAHVKQVLRDHQASCIPVVDSDHKPIGMVTASDMLSDLADSVTVSDFMSKNVLTVPKYGDVSLAARVMRNHKIHHVVVTEENKVVGLVSSFDLLRLVEDHRFVMKNPPTESKKKGGKRRQSEVLGKPE